ncbi:hypothetical protein KIN20_011140 [Parelaphostrongylus tenuis]|uniref:Uncharacterized protein n=1 Tax=Parelaphostrongylus tenuis TaxID=148309 RepID=A0AAD5QLU8_PARTN|nr:hypothetical protein KIN20_011140 [Parelaphostrongylus tenuis]
MLDLSSFSPMIPWWSRGVFHSNRAPQQEVGSTADIGAPASEVLRSSGAPLEEMSLTSGAALNKLRW